MENVGHLYGLFHRCSQSALGDTVADSQTLLTPRTNS
jgi:hypothetical protein